MLKKETSSNCARPVASKAASLEPPSGNDSSKGQAAHQIGFIGLGHMGTAMAANLITAGRRVVAYVRRPDQMEKLVGLGVKPTMEITDLFDSDVVISMLPDDAAVHQVVFGDQSLDFEGLAKGMTRGAIHLSMSTISTATSSQLASEHARYGQGYVAAPVFGNPDAAKARQLFIVAAGAAAEVERCQLLLEVLGQQLFIVGTNPVHANLIKLAGNVLTAATLEMLGEVIALIRKRGLDPKLFLDILTQTMFGGRAHTIYGDKIVAQRYTPGFVMPLALKDVRLALAEAEIAAVPMPSVSVVRDRLITGVARGYADLDWSALGLVAADESGLTPGSESTEPEM
jgi:3-hydroxyisobutyrate dehydrogenase-like beta-hydroxyacid dehydrogenase